MWILKDEYEAMLNTLKYIRYIDKKTGKECSFDYNTIKRLYDMYLASLFIK